MPILAAPLFLAALAIAGVPIALHLLHKRNPKPFQFSTLRFLQEAITKTRRARQVTQLLVLLLRILIIALLAFAFALPRLPVAGWLPDGPRVVVIVLDTSASMRTRDGEKTNFDKARTWALALLGSLRERDKVALLAPGSENPRVVFPAVSNHGLVEKALRDLPCGYGSAALVSELRDLHVALLQHHPHEVVEVHLFSDLQQSAWDSTDVKDLGTLFMAHDRRLFVERVSNPRTPNAAISSLRLVPDALLGDGELTARIGVRANAFSEGANTARLEIDGKEVAQQGLTLYGNATEEVNLSTSVPGQAAFATGDVRLDADAFMDDNVRYFALERREHVNVLLVDGSPAALENQRDTYYLERALNPRQVPNPLFLATKIDFAKLAATDLQKYAVVFIANPPALTDNVALPLEQYARKGGTVVLYPGARDGLPGSLARLQPLAGLTAKPEKFGDSQRFRTLRSDNASAIELEAAKALGKLPEFMGSQRLQLSATNKGWPRYLLTEAGTPLAVQAPCGLGAIWVVAVTANRTWSEWPLSPDFVLFHQLIIRHSLGNIVTTRSLEIGQAAELPWTGVELQVQVLVSPPTGKNFGLTLDRTELTRPFLLPGFWAPGVYRIDLRTEPPVTRYVAVNLPPAESVLTPVEPDDLARQLAPLPVYQPKTVEQMQEMLAGQTHGHPLWPSLLLLAFLVAISESVFANWRSWAQGVPEALRQVLGRRTT